MDLFRAWHENRKGSAPGYTDVLDHSGGQDPVRYRGSGAVHGVLWLDCAGADANVLFDGDGGRSAVAALGGEHRSRAHAVCGAKGCASDGGLSLDACHHVAAARDLRTRE